MRGSGDARVRGVARAVRAQAQGALGGGGKGGLEVWLALDGCARTVGSDDTREASERADDLVTRVRPARGRHRGRQWPNPKAVRCL